MLEMTTGIKDVDYGSIVQAAIPLLEKNPDALGNSLLVKGIVKMVLKNRSTVAAIVTAIPEEIKKNLFVLVISYYAENIKKTLQDIVEQKKIGITIEKIETEKDSSGELALKISASEIDYNAVVASVLPFLHFDTEKNEAGKFLNEIIRVLQDVPSATDMIVAHISHEIKTDMAVFVIMRYEDYICSALQNFARQHGIQAQVERLAIVCNAVA